MWEVDCQIGDDLGQEAINNTKLHSKYLNALIDARMRMAKIDADKAVMRAEKSKYFRGEMTKEELDARGWTQWQYRSLKSDIDGLIDADADYQKLVARESYVRLVIAFIDSVMGEIKNRGWNIKNGIDWIKYRNGS